MRSRPPLRNFLPQGRSKSRSLTFVVTLLFGTCMFGCGKKTATVDTTPFSRAVAAYLNENDMALRIKAIKTGPDIDGDKATMAASMTHAELGGPSVTWVFEFRKQNGTWAVVRHTD